MFSSFRTSQWEFVTSAGQAASQEVATAGKGHLVVKKGSVQLTLNYRYGGVGYSKGTRGFQLSTEGFPSKGNIFISDGFHAPELAERDFEGFCAIQEASVAGAQGLAATVFLVGVPVYAVPSEIISEVGLGILNPGGPTDWIPNWMLGVVGAFRESARSGGVAAEIFENKAKAAIVMRSMSFAFQISVGVSFSIGYIWLGNFEDTELAKITTPTRTLSSEDVTMRYSWREKDDSLITLPGDVLFPFDEPKFPTGYKFRPEATLALRKAVSLLRPLIRMKPVRRMQIWGHTDWIGPRIRPDEYNMDLSRRRANAVKEWLIAQRPALLDASKIDADGKGRTEPVAPNTTPDGRQKNRRVEIYLVR